MIAGCPKKLYSIAYNFTSKRPPLGQRSFAIPEFNRSSITCGVKFRRPNQNCPTPKKSKAALTSAGQSCFPQQAAHPRGLG